MPGMKGASAVVHAGTALGAAFTEYTAEFEAGGELGSTPAQRFFFVIDGALTLESEGKQKELGARGYAYVPEGTPHNVKAAKRSRAVAIEKSYERVATGEPPPVLLYIEDASTSHAFRAN